MWLVWALAGTTLASGAVLVDKSVLEDRERTVSTVAVLTGGLAGISSMALFAAGGVPAAPLEFVLPALGGGALLFAYLVPYFAALRDSSPDRVVAWFQITPLIATGTAVVVLGQQLSAWQWFGGACLVGGAVSAELSGAGGIRGVQRRSVLAMLAAASLFAAAEVLLARAAEHAPEFRLLIAFSGLGSALAALLFWSLQRRSATLNGLGRRLLGLLALAELLNLAFVVAHQRALGMADVGIVSATAGVQPLVITLMLASFGPPLGLPRMSSAVATTALAYMAIAVGVAVLALAEAS